MNQRLAALTMNNDTDVANVAHALHDQIVGLKATLNRNAFALGAALAEMRDHDLYRALGFGTFEDYLVGPQVGIQRGTAYRFMRIYQTFRDVQTEAAKLDWTKLDILAQIVREGDAPDRILPLVEQAAEMSRDELRAGVRAGKQQRIIATPPAPPAPDDEEEPYAYPAPSASEWIRPQAEPSVYGIPALVAETLRPAVVAPPPPTPLHPPGPATEAVMRDGAARALDPDARAQFEEVEGKLLDAVRAAKRGGPLFDDYAPDELAAKLQHNPEGDWRLIEGLYRKRLAVQQAWRRLHGIVSIAERGA